MAQLTSPPVLAAITITTIAAACTVWAWAADRANDQEITEHEPAVRPNVRLIRDPDARALLASLRPAREMPRHLRPEDDPCGAPALRRKA